jgi:hypothetical protein
MLESSVVFAPRLRGTEKTRSVPPWSSGVQRRKGDVRAHLIPENTSRFVSSSWATIRLQAALKNSSRSTALTLVFSAEAKTLERPPDGGVAQIPTRKVFEEVTSLWVTVAAGRSFTSSSRSVSTLWSAFGGRPELFLGVREPPWLAILK